MVLRKEVETIQKKGMIMERLDTMSST